MEIFPSLFGNERLKATFGRDFAGGTFSHAYIIEGPDGSGRMTAALSAAASLGCTEKAAGTVPCGKCVSCRKVFGGLSADVVIISANDKKTIGVDAVRDIKAGLWVTPNDGDYRVYVIEDADTMTAQAQNALLISLEEPPPFVIFMLLCTDAGAMLETIRSRAPVVRTERLSPERIMDFLVTDENGAKLIAHDRDKAKSVAVMCGGSAGKATQLCAEAMKKSAKPSPEEEQRTTAAGLTEALILGQRAKALELMRSIPKGRENSRAVIGYVGDAVRDLMLFKSGADAQMIFYANADDAMRLASRVSPTRLAEIYSASAEYSAYLEQNASEAVISTLFATV